MPGRIILEVITGPMKGAQFEFDSHDTFIFGRRKKICNLCLSKDPRVSRHHFILETNPPDAVISDLGSLSGTFVNGVKIGGQHSGESPERGSKSESQQVALNHNDVIKVGRTEIRVTVLMPVVCQNCGILLGAEDTSTSGEETDQRCSTCCIEHEVAEQTDTVIGPPHSMLCQECGKDVSEELGARRRGLYVCQQCQGRLGSSPLERVRSLMASAADEAQAKVLKAIDDYEIVEKLGAGGMATVYKAKRKTDKKTVAVKVLHARVAVDPRSRDEFLREMKATRRLNHQHIVAFLDCSSDRGIFYLVTECCAGGCLNKLFLKHGTLTPRQLAPLMIQILRGLAYAHKKGFVHRDLKPANILLSRSEKGMIAKISDFGLAKNFQTAGLSGMTTTGNVKGTYSFMPVEQLVNYKYVTPASDVWSCAATFYKLLTGSMVRDSPQDVSPIEIVLTEKPVPILEREASIPPALAKVLDKALAEDAKNRFQDAAEFLKNLKQAMQEDGFV